MAKQSKIRQAAGTILFMVVLTSVAVFVVSLSYNLTKSTIDYNKALQFRKAVLKVSGLTLPDDDQAVGKMFDDNITQVSDNGRVLYYKIKDGGYVFNIHGAGLWGTIRAVMGIDMSMSSITGIYFTEQQETPGLGARIDEKWFREQFKGKVPPLSMVPEKTPSEPHQFDAVTGATITSTAVKDMINRGFKEAPKIVKGKNQ